MEEDDGYQSEDGYHYVETDPSGRYGRYSEILGKGSFKIVYRAFDGMKGIEVAWNKVKLDNATKSPEILGQLYSEVHILQNLKHKNIMKIQYSWIDTGSRSVNFISELFTSGTLREYSRKHKSVSLQAIKKWSRQILQGLNYLHSQDPPVLHRDLKCDNIFVNGNSGNVKIGDFGLATVLKQGHLTQLVGTPEFMAPEMYNQKGYNELVDIYSYGMCVVELLTLEYPYSECTNFVQIYKTIISGKKPGALNKLKDPEVRAFVERCLAVVSERPTATELLEDPFLRIENLGESGNSLAALDANYLGTPRGRDYPLDPFLLKEDNWEAMKLSKFSSPTFYTASNGKQAELKEDFQRSLSSSNCNGILHYNREGWSNSSLPSYLREDSSVSRCLPHEDSSSSSHLRHVNSFCNDSFLSPPLRRGYSFQDDSFLSSHPRHEDTFRDDSFLSSHLQHEDTFRDDSFIASHLCNEDVFSSAQPRYEDSFSSSHLHYEDNFSSPYPLRQDNIPSSHFRRQDSSVSSLYEYEKPSRRSINAKGERRDDDTISMKFRIADNGGSTRVAKFSFKLDTDTALSVAHEIILGLDLFDQDVNTIAEIIDAEVSALIPDWNSSSPNEEIIHDGKSVKWAGCLDGWDHFPTPNLERACYGKCQHEVHGVGEECWREQIYG